MAARRLTRLIERIRPRGRLFRIGNAEVEPRIVNVSVIRRSERGLKEEFNIALTRGQLHRPRRDEVVHRVKVQRLPLVHLL